MTEPSTPEVGQSADVDRTARTIKGDSPVRAPTVELRQATVASGMGTDGKISVNIGGDTVVIPGVSLLSNYKAVAGDTCWVLVNGSDILALDRDAVRGSSAFGFNFWAAIDTEQTRSSTSYGDLATVGPSLSIQITNSGVALVGVGVRISPGVNLDGGWVSFALSGANTASPLNRWAVSAYLGDNNTHTRAGAVTMLTGLDPGITTFTLKYASIFGGSTAFSLRTLWVLPL